MHGEVQQTAIVLVEKLRANDQEMLWSTQAGLEILMQFQLGDARLFFARPFIAADHARCLARCPPRLLSTKLVQAAAGLDAASLVWLPQLSDGLSVAVAPGVEDHIRDTVASDAEKARREEEQKWHNILQSLKDKDWPYKMGRERRSVGVRTTLRMLCVRNAVNESSSSNVVYHSSFHAIGNAWPFSLTLHRCLFNWRKAKRGQCAVGAYPKRWCVAR